MNQEPDNVEPSISVIIDNGDDECDGEGMALLTEEFTERIDPELLTQLGWRAVWLHRALTDPSGNLLTPRDRELLVLVATAPLGVSPGAASRHLRRFGTSPAAAQLSIERLVQGGHLSVGADLRLDLPVTDLDWIEHHRGDVSPARVSPSASANSRQLDSRPRPPAGER